MDLINECREVARDGVVKPKPLPIKAGIGVVPAKPEGAMGLASFYAHTLPATGNYALFRVGNRKHIWATSIADLVTQTELLGDKPDIYFATATFNAPGERTQANAAYLKSFRLDLDAGEAKLAKHGADSIYATQQDAIVDVVRFAKATKLTPSLIVSSGEGLHLYWELDEPLAAAAWTPIAKQFQKFGTAQGLKIDASVTADSARILRPVGTLHPNGKRVEVIRATGLVYTAVEFAQAVGVAPVAQADVSPQYDLSINDDLGNLDPEYPPRTYDIGVMKGHCDAVKHAIDAPATIAEPYWRAMIGLVKHTSNGRANAHSFSKKHPLYDPDETDEYFDRYAAGPTTCAKFAEFNPTACAGCKHQGNIKSPIVLGQILESIGAITAPPAKALLMSLLPDWNLSKEGAKTKPQNTTSNVAALASYLKCDLRYNVMTKRTETTMPGNLVPRDDLENSNLVFLGDACVRAGMARNGLAELVDAVAGSNAYHPVQDWIKRTSWDGISRMSQFHDSLELVNPSHSQLRDTLLDAWCLQAIGALEQPGGIAAQGVLVLVGLQDTQKTRWVKSLCPVPGAVREGLHLDPLNKDSVLQATNSWISELGELDSTTRKSDVSALKAFTTRDEDVLRPAYARRENVYRRRTVFAGSVNGTGFLVDETGDRRFWTVAVKYCHLLAPDLMQQVWAEYFDRYVRGERWYLDAGTKAALVASNSDHRAIDPIRERIATRFDWSSVDWNKVDPVEYRDHKDVQWMTATDVCVLIGLDRPTKADATRAGTVLRELNRVTSRKSNGIQLLGVPTERMFKS